MKEQAAPQALQAMVCRRWAVQRTGNDAAAALRCRRYKERLGLDATGEQLRFRA
jgi:hypothetical protein